MQAGFTIEEKAIQAFSGEFTLPEMEKIPVPDLRPKVIVLSGPTGIGKTKLSLIIAQALGGEIVSADSMQVYKGMNIGTAKVSPEEQKQIPHHLIDIREISEKFNVVDFYFEAHQAIQKVLARGAVPIVIGGTGFYIRALIYGPPSGPPSIYNVRERLEQEMLEKGSDWMFEKLKKLDPDYASTITQNDKQKIIRGLEIMALTGKKVSDFPKQSSLDRQPYNFRCWFLSKQKELLYPAIEARCDYMIAHGLLEEVKALAIQGLSKNLTASQAIGYRQCLDYLSTDQTQIDWQKFLIAFKQASRRYAKRQFTWFRKEPLFRWLDMDLISSEQAVEIIIQDYEVGD
ncbi:MAG: tRNA (adenosine(37)-N6)-dimethylallyltransferase MiaA [Chlamydiae bacterium]|nr:tRNA (adenosine(37)-N6)-dimethylallyltransferase MiaA [Chlamydiota bacterium]